MGNDTAQGLILINLVANNAQLEWYKNLEIGVNYSKKYEDMLLAIEVKKSSTISSQIV